jgi:peptide/nickel transport system substrate-binding protein
VSVVPDDNARALKLLRGEVDVTQSSLSLTKERWIQREHAGQFDILEREGTNVSYLAFNLRDKLLARREVRQAISEAIDREGIVRDKLQGMGRVASSLLSPKLPECLPQDFKYDPAHAERLLDATGLPRRGGPKGTRFELRYRTNTTREFIETGLMIQEQLGRIGIKVVLDVVESAVFLASIKKGAFQMYSSVWAGISDGSILYQILRTGQAANRVKYSDPEMDRILDAASSEADDRKRIRWSQAAQRMMARDLPYFPLWYWDNMAIVRKGLTGLRASELSLSGSYEPLTRLH